MPVPSFLCAAAASVVIAVAGDGPIQLFQEVVEIVVVVVVAAVIVVVVVGSVDIGLLLHDLRWSDVVVWVFSPHTLPQCSRENEGRNGLGPGREEEQHAC